MNGNRELFERLSSDGTLDLKRSALFDQALPPLAQVDFSRVEGMMLGLAIGDALGNTSEGMRPHERRHQHGRISAYLPNRYAGGRPVGLPSDDTQLAFWTLEQLLDDGRMIPERLMEIFASRQVFGIGSAVREAMGRWHAGHPWYECGARSAGNGALMRIAPALMPHLNSATAELWVDAALAAAVTHNDPGSTAACVAFVGMLWELLGMDSLPEPSWWHERYVELAADIEGGASYSPRGGAFVGYCGPIWRFVEQRLPEAHTAGLGVVDACNRWYSGAFLLETVPSALYILGCHGHDPQQALISAVNDTVDNDTVGAIVGAAMGALHGIVALPEQWRSGLVGRTGPDDDGRVHELLARAREMVCG